MKNVALKAALAAMGVSYCDEKELTTIIEVLEKEHGIIFYKPEVALSDIKDVIKQMSESANDVKIVFEPIAKKHPKRKWVVPKKIGKPQKRKGRF